MGRPWRGRERGGYFESAREVLWISVWSGPGAVDATTYVCLRGDEGDCQGETEATGFGFEFDITACCILSDCYCYVGRKQSSD
jgi:hypothetical protein